MNDKQIIDLYFSRSEQSIKEAKIKYSSFCRKIAYNILSNNEDTDECENDTYLKIWNSIPPNNPENFKAYIGKITRNIALDIWKKNHTQKRNAGIEILFSEMEDILSVPQTDTEYELEEITPIINLLEIGEIENILQAVKSDKEFQGLSKKEQALFILRYWQGESVKSIAKQWNTSSNKLSGKLFRLRNNLKQALEKEGIFL